VYELEGVVFSEVSGIPVVLEHFTCRQWGTIVTVKPVLEFMDTSQSYNENTILKMISKS
jgi:hypothetical protein